MAEAAKEIGLLPRAGSGKTLPAEHALEHKLSDSPWISASERRKGAPRFEGEPIRIDVEEAVRTGSEYISNKELQGHVREYGKANPEWAHPAEIWRNNQSGRLGEREALLKGPVEPSAIETKALRGARGLAKGLGVAGVALSGYRIATASPEEQTQVAAEEAAGWAGAMLAGEVGAQFGAAAGPWGALVGGVVGGIVGYLGGSSYVRALFELGKDQPPEYGIIADQPGLLFRRPV